MTLEDLQRYTLSLSVEEQEALADEGLFVHQQLRAGDYDSSPHGHLAFASTGGDGTHFSIPANADGPVIMTVPMAFESPNVVVGKNLEEFLSLGCVYGYFALEQLAYNLAPTAAKIEAATEQSAVLRNLSSHFGLRPWTRVLERLAELRAQQTGLQGS